MCVCVHEHSSLCLGDRVSEALRQTDRQSRNHSIYVRLIVEEKKCSRFRRLHDSCICFGEQERGEGGGGRAEDNL